MSKKFVIIVFSHFSVRLHDLPLVTTGKKRTFIGIFSCLMKSHVTLMVVS